MFFPRTLALAALLALATPARAEETAAPPAALADSFCPDCRRPATWEQEKCAGCGMEFEPLRPRTRKGEGAPAGAAEPAPAPGADTSPFPAPKQGEPPDKAPPGESIIPSPWRQIQPPEQSRFGFGGYGRVGFDVATDLEGAKPLDIVEFAPILGKQPYAELHFFYKDKLNEMPVLVKSTLAFGAQIFHYTGEFDAQMALRELYAELNPLPELALWVGARMYRGDNVYIFDFWPLDDQNTLGGGAAFKFAEYHRIQAHVGVNRITNDDTFFQFQEIELPLDGAVGTRSAVFLDRNRGVASLTYGLELPVGFRAKVHGEGHYLPSGDRRLPSGVDEHLPSDHGFLIGGEVGLFAEQGSFANLFCRYSTGLAAFDELQVPFGFDTDLQVTDAERLLMALGGAVESQWAGAHFGAYYQRFRDADGVADREDFDQYAVAMRPLLYLGQYFRTGFEVCWEWNQHQGIIPETGSEELQQLTKLTFLVGVAPRPGVFARPELNIFFSLKWLNRAATLDLGRNRLAERPDNDEQSFGLLAEWWF